EDSLFDSGETPAWFPGFGPIPATSAREIIAENEAAVFIRRLYTRPTDGQLVRMDSKRREFSGLLRRMVVIRDDVCRSPWCDAQIKHADHSQAFAAGGETDWDNASGLCAACNFLKELPGWRHEATAEELIVRTPTGHRYQIGTRPIGTPTTKTSGLPRSDLTDQPTSDGADDPDLFTVRIPPLRKVDEPKLDGTFESLKVDMWECRDEPPSVVETCMVGRLAEFASAV
ncbi:MAG: HNH endonuclease, partial [Brevibacterium sp.]|nr:HNH endonuclease [Brevibacterium sp.]